MMALVDELDLSEFTGVYRADGKGRPPYAPKVMLTLILYCRSKGLMSGREVAAACHDDLGARIITGNRYPDRSTVDKFLVRHAVALKGLLAQTLRIGHAEGLVDVSVVAGDGTKVVANAAMSATVDADELDTQIIELQRQVAAAEQVWAEQVGAEAGTADVQPTLFGGGDPAGGGLCGPPAGQVADGAWRTVRRLTGMLHRRQNVRAHLHARPDTAMTDWQERLERDQRRVIGCTHHYQQLHAEVQARYERRVAAVAAGARIPGTRPVPADQNAHVAAARKALDTAIARAAKTAATPPAAGRVNTTDPTSAIMPGKHDGYDQRHNVQALACKGPFVLAIGTHPSPNDKQALITLIQAGRANLDTAAITDRIGTALFDSGYASADNFAATLPVDQLLVAVEKEARQTGRLHDETTTAAHAWQDMANRLADPGNRTLYKQRSTTIEPLFAHLFTRFGRTIHARAATVDSELHLWATTHNLLKISRHRHRRPG
jgi:transposase